MHLNSDKRLREWLECCCGMRHGCPMRIATTLILVLLSFQSLAYSTANHKRITTAAADLIRRCELPLPLSAQQLDQLVDLNLGQDGVLKKMRLWHFPAPPKDSGNPAPQKQRAWLYGKLVTQTTFDRWVSYLDDQIRQQADFAQRLPGIGALLHYVQDLAVPAHAVPIFHPTRIANADKLDSWKNLQPEAKSLLPATAATCTTIRDGDLDSVGNFLSQLRNLTLNSLQQPLGPGCQGKNCRWSRYWSQRVLADGFAEYGCDGKDVFGKRRFSCAGEKYIVKAQVYKVFAAARFQDAVIGSAQALFYYSRLPAAAGAAQPQWLPNKKLLQGLQGSY